jgi:lysophospholipase L1-like esterase
MECDKKTKNNLVEAIMKDSVKTVLCYGDSNTWGYIPGTGGRYSAFQRWTGVLRESLGEGYTVIEEGLNGRTTVWDDPIELHKNGASYLPPCLATHKPIDLVILMLGTNDLKKRFSLSPYDIAAGADRLIQIIRTSGCGVDGASPRVLLLCPPYVGPLSSPFDEMFEGAGAKSRQLKLHFTDVARQNQCEFFDTAELVTASAVDGIHLEVQAHKMLGEALAKRVSAII